MDIATITDAAVGTEVYYLEHIYMVVMLILILLFVSFVSARIRSMYKKLRSDDND